VKTPDGPAKDHDEMLMNIHIEILWGFFLKEGAAQQE
jgi:hypothetical protein